MFHVSVDIDNSTTKQPNNFKYLNFVAGRYSGSEIQEVLAIKCMFQRDVDSLTKLTATTSENGKTSYTLQVCN